MVEWTESPKVPIGSPGLRSIDPNTETTPLMYQWQAMMLEDDQALEQMASIGLRFLHDKEFDMIEIARIDKEPIWNPSPYIISMSKLPRLVELAAEVGLEFVNCHQEV